MAEESKFEKHLIKLLKQLYPGCIIMKNDANRLQGIPDRLILYNNHWAAFEVKASKNATKRPNQDFYVQKLGKMSYAAFVYPENEEEFLDELQQALRPRRKTRLPGSK